MKKTVSKTEQTKQEIAEAFLLLINKYPLNEITIDSLSKACGINRNTFYYHFNNIADLIEYVIKGIVDHLLTKYPPKIDSLEDCFIAGINFARNNKNAINNIYHSTSRAIFERHLWHVCDYSVNAYLESVPKNVLLAKTPEEIDTLRDFIKFECFGFIIDWINRDMPEDVTEKIKTLVNLPIFRQMSKNVH